MRRIIAGLFMSLDGVVESPETWAYQYFNDEMTQVMAEGIAQADAVLLGRRTYLQFAALWPARGSGVPMAAFLNTTHKYIASSTLATLEWGPASLVTGDLAENLVKLKRHGLLDELSLWIPPIVVGSGMRLFEGPMNQIRLKLSQSAGFSTGVVSTTYQPLDVDRAVGGTSIGHPRSSPNDQGLRMRTTPSALDRHTRRHVDGDSARWTGTGDRVQTANPGHGALEPSRNPVADV
jgi:dihydrofolate reductase